MLPEEQTWFSDGIPRAMQMKRSRRAALNMSKLNYKLSTI
jgi:hypothetical protein